MAGSWVGVKLCFVYSTQSNSDTVDEGKGWMKWETVNACERMHDSFAL